MNQVEKKEYDQLHQEYEELRKKYEDLRNECNENTVLQSMNDMKERYEHLVANTVPAYKYEGTLLKLERAQKTLTGGVVLVEHVIKAAKTLASGIVIDTTKISKIQLELYILKDILEGST